MQSKSAAVAAVGAAKSSAFIFFVAMLVGMLIFKLVRHCESKREMQRARQADTPDNVEIKKGPAFAAGPKRVIGSENYGYVRHPYTNCVVSPPIARVGR